MRKKEVAAAIVPPPPSLFSRGIVVSSPRTVIFLSGTCSHRARGIRAQTFEVYENITALLKHAGATWTNVVHCRFFMQNIKRDFTGFDRARREFFARQGIKPPYPASTGVQARLVRDKFLIEMEVTAVT